MNSFLKIIKPDYDTNINVKVFLAEDAILPQYQTTGSSGCDLYSSEDAVISPGETKLIKTNLYVKIPEGYEIQIRPRSGLALKYSITVLNTPGTIDSDYIDNICIILINHGKSDFFVYKGDRIAQAVLSKSYKINFIQVESQEELKKDNINSNRSGGFGSTGI